VEFDEMQRFERELKEALQRRPAPPSLKRKVMARRGQQAAERRHSHILLWQRLAASVMLAAVLGGVMEWQLQRAEERRRGEEARRQVMTALRITGHALDEVNAHLAGR
jgi:anti-sigma factor RsiW